MRKRAGISPTLFAFQDKGAAGTSLKVLAAPDVLTCCAQGAAGHYIFLAFFFAFFAMVSLPAVPIIGRSG